MTIPNENVRNGPYNTNGVVTDFAFTFKIQASSQIVVVKTDANNVDTMLTINTDYTVAGVGVDGGGVVTISPALATGFKITLYRKPSFTQLLDLVNQGAYNADDVEAALDLAAMGALYVKGLIDRALYLSTASVDGSGYFDARLNKISNLAAAILPADAVTLAQLQAQFAAGGNVPSPTGGQISQFLKATGVGAFGWNLITDADVPSSGYLRNADAPVNISTTPATFTTAEIGKVISLNAGSSVLNLPVIATGFDKKVMVLKNPQSSTPVTVNAGAGNTIFAASAFTLQPGTWVIMMGNSTNWTFLYGAGVGLTPNGMIYSTPGWTLDIATAANYRAGTANKILDAAAGWAGAAEVSLGNLTGSVTLDFSAGIDFGGIATGNITLANPNNVKPGQKGAIRINQDATGSRTITFGSSFKHPFGVAPVLSTPANSIDFLFYDAQNTNYILITGMAKAVA